MEIYPITHDHASLLNLAWSVSGHTFDAEVDFNGQDITNINDISCARITVSNNVTVGETCFMKRLLAGGVT